MKKFFTIMMTVAVLMVASQRYAAPANLISGGSSGWNYGIIGGSQHQNLANNFWSVNYGSVNWATPGTGQGAFGNTLATPGQSALGNWLNGQGMYLPSQTPWDNQTALMLKKNFTYDPSFGQVSLNVASDNGFIVWINGKEVYRSTGDWFTSYWEYNNLTVPSSFLNSGNNTLYALAIDDAPLHVWDATFFDLSANAAVPLPPALILFVTGLAAVFGIKRKTA